jgi:hypothetical protein
MKKPETGTGHVPVITGGVPVKTGITSRIIWKA